MKMRQRRKLFWLFKFPTYDILVPYTYIMMRSHSRKIKL